MVVLLAVTFFRGGVEDLMTDEEAEAEPVCRIQRPRLLAVVEVAARWRWSFSFGLGAAVERMWRLGPPSSRVDAEVGVAGRLSNGALGRGRLAGSSRKT